MMRIRHFLSSRLPAFLIPALLIPGLTNAQQLITSGTGFFISKAGHIITNEHVVKGCDSVMVRGAVEPAQAEVIKTDPQIDLALLKTKAIPPRVAPIRDDSIPIKKGEKLLLIGYPEKHGMTGIYKISHSRVIDVTDPMGGDQWVLFEDAARQGNSGGPLLDGSGNVIGVIMGKTTFYQYNLLDGEQRKLFDSDLAISLPYLWNFLEGENVYTVTQHSALLHGENYLERQASEFIVNIHCAH